LKSLTFAAVAATLLLSASVAARADDWPLVRHDAQNSGATVEAMRPPFTKSWTKKGATNEPLLVAGNTLLYTSKRGAGLRDLQAVNATTGAALWTLKNVTQTGATSPKEGLAFTILRTTDKPTAVSKLGANLWPTAIAGVDLKTGKVLWTYPIGEHPTYPAVSPLTVSGNTVYLVNIPYCVPGEDCGQGELIALNDRTGKEVAKFGWDEVWAGQIGVVHGAPLIDSAGKYVSIGLGYQAAPDAYGGQVWVFPTGARLQDGPLHRLGDPSVGTGEVSPYAHKGGNVWPLLGGTFLAVQGPLETTRVWDVSEFPARLKWEIRFTRDRAHSLMPGGANPMLLEFNSGTKLLTAMYMSTGKNIWSKAMKVTGLSATAGNTVFVPGQTAHPVKAGAAGRSDIQDGILYALDTMTGKSLWSIRRPDVTYNTPVPANGRLYVSDSDGNLECYVSAAAAKAKK
jgi:outer membrane protein assembly factor BamB